MKGMRAFEEYRMVGGPATVEVTVGGAVEAVGLEGFLISSTEIRRWTKAELAPGPAVAAIEPGRIYQVVLRFAFLADAQVVATVKVIKEDGVVHSQPTEWTLQGTAGETAVRTVLIRA